MIVLGPFITSVKKFIFILASYYIAARAGLYLHIPDGQASIIWPAAGIAMGAIYVLGYRYAPAIFCAAFLSSLYFYETIDLRAVSIAACIGFGAALQASMGTLLIKKYVKSHTTLENVKDIGQLMFLGGPIACCTSAFIATSTLYLSGIINAQSYISHAYSWWLGDMFGVLVFTPLVILIFSKGKAKSNISLKRKLLVSIPAISVFTIFLALFFSTKNELMTHAFDEYQAKTSNLINEFKKDLAVDLSSLIAIKSFFNASEFVSAKEFEIFTKPLLDNSNGMFGVAWIPKVLHQDRKLFENSIREQGYQEFSIKSRTGINSLKTADAREIYFPIGYVQPYDKNHKAHGFDVYGEDLVSGTMRKEILDNARDSGKKRATSRFSIVQKEDQYGFIVYVPLYKTSLSQQSLEERRIAHIGYVNGIFVFPKLMSTLHKKTQSMGLEIVLEEANTRNAIILFDSRTENFEQGPPSSYVFDDLTFASEEFSVAGKLWKITIIRNTPLLSNVYKKELWTLVAGGILFSSLLSILLMIITARTEEVEKLVAQKTQDLKKANEELEEFAYRTSHDLRSPVISSIGLLTLVEEMISQGEHDKVLKSVNLVKSSLTKLEILVQDILTLTHLKGAAESQSPVNFRKLTKDAFNKFEHMENFSRLKIQTEYNFDGEVIALKSRVRLIIENLINNAIKYQDPKITDPYIKITTNENENGFIFEIEDNGLGIPPDKVDSLFRMFERFHPKTSYGSGLGLYMVKKSADILGAKISFENIDKGARFKLIIPK